MGFNSGLSADSTSFHARLGIRQEIGAIIPKVNLTTDDGTAKIGPNAASSYVAMKVRSEGMNSAPEVQEIIASGVAARNLASSEKRLIPFN